MLRETPLYLRLNAADDVVIACRDLEQRLAGPLRRDQLPHLAQLNPPARRNRRVVLAVLAPELHPAVVAFARGAEERVEFLLRGARLGVEIGGHPA